MKGYVHRYLCSLLLLVGIALVNVSAKDVYFLGDANNDGKVSVADVVEILNSINGKSSDKFNFDLADINEDGGIDITDVVEVIDLIISNKEAKARRIDTIKVTYHEDHVTIGGTYNPQRIKTSVQGNAGLSIVSTWKRPFVCIAEGKCPDGSLRIVPDTTCTLVLDNLELSSSESAVVCFPMKQKVSIELSKGSNNILSDAASRNKDDESINGCLYGKGTLTFTGKGALTVTGNFRHGIVSSKNVSVEGSHLIINKVLKNGIHCDKFTLKDGQIDLHLQNDASKGIKAKEELVIKSGVIEGDAIGNITNEDGDLSYCSLLKSDGTMTISGGTLTLKQYGDGGRCISVDKDLTMTAGTMNLECHGDGGQYMNTSNVLDYYTPKCITVNKCTRIERGKINLLATGAGGKGLDSSDSLIIGRKADGYINEDSLCIVVETRGFALVDNADEDYRKGCPKAIKTDNEMEIYSGTLRISTKGQGGEGIESKYSLRLYKCTILCDCYDDGINTGMRCYIDGAHVLCISHNNDGIDSNGKISIVDGIVAAISEHAGDESFDTNGGQLNLFGGYIIGIGYDEVEISPQSTIPYYSTPSYLLQDHYHHGDNVTIQQDNYLTISNGYEAVISLYHNHSSSDAFITIASPLLKKEQTYNLSDSEKPRDAESEWFDGRIIIGGKLANIESILTFKPL